ncbi:glycine--tRNA ligase subunit alpha [Rickettsia endosymbiont of Cardiosporidium cionae]|uniref:glycine--tRNA ligase subunit alpha n=1 Tax=Rickettsia endosymbiont of Cardiosporidium cionae TaxID=2777155 RepID=UPI001893F1A1|nr:glycine--tRNA ligase subunit alpha [Rickettsia endosymbiont of Cardiosporidium cionae]KAF8818659.1 glycine--tRNA ligase subunit alpha [Rickettsia endosymbiont of Cardiosporidium cionae]
MQVLSFQQIISLLQNYWSDYGCVVLQPYDLEMGAGTFHPATVLKSLIEYSWNAAYVQPSRRPTDSRYSAHPNRLGRYYQFQVILKPSPDNMQQLYLDSLLKLGLNIEENDIRFIEDDWESPTLGASGMGWEVCCNGMEISQFTYMQQMAGIDIFPVLGEITYGLERLALYIQQKDQIKDIVWNYSNNGKKLFTYGELEFISEKQFSQFSTKFSNTELLFQQFQEAEQISLELIHSKLPIVAYDYCIKASHLFNLLDAHGVISVTERAAYIIRIRNLVKLCCSNLLNMNKKADESRVIN